MPRSELPPGVHRVRRSTREGNKYHVYAWRGDRGQAGAMAAAAPIAGLEIVPERAPMKQQERTI